MIKELLYKWFNLQESCRTCEVLERELDRVQREKELLLEKLLASKESRAPESVITEELKPVPSGGRRFMPAVVRQQMIEQNDKQTLQLMMKHKKDLNEAKKEVMNPEEKAYVEKSIEELEKELGVEDASPIS